MDGRIVCAGDVVLVQFPGVDAPLLAEVRRILDGRGRRRTHADLLSPPPYSMLVVEFDGQERCVPLWPTGEEAPRLVEAMRQAG